MRCAAASCPVIACHLDDCLCFPLRRASRARKGGAPPQGWEWCGSAREHRAAATVL